MRKLVHNLRHRRELKQEFATRLRIDATDAERKLWSLLRSKQFGGLRFRRQQPIGPYIVDFYCSAAKLIVELDGEQHGEENHVRYDENRTRWLLAHGYRVLRYPNVEFLKTPQIALDGIAHVLDEQAIPLPKLWTVV